MAQNARAPACMDVVRIFGGIRSEPQASGRLRNQIIGVLYTTRYETGDGTENGNYHHPEPSLQSRNVVYLLSTDSEEGEGKQWWWW